MMTYSADELRDQAQDALEQGDVEGAQWLADNADDLEEMEGQGE